PARLAAHDIPIEARIVGIADAFAAMREARPYRPARSRQAAVNELRQGAGKQVDPDLVEPPIASLVLEDSRALQLVVHRATLAIPLERAKDSPEARRKPTCAGGRPLRTTAAGSGRRRTLRLLTDREGDRGIGTYGG